MDDERITPLNKVKFHRCRVFFRNPGRSLVRGFPCSVEGTNSEVWGSMRSITPNFMVIIGGLKSADMIWTLLLRLSVVIPLRLEVGESCAAGSPRTFTTHNVPGADPQSGPEGFDPWHLAAVPETLACLPGTGEWSLLLPGPVFLGTMTTTVDDYHLRISYGLMKAHSVL